MGGVAVLPTGVVWGGAAASPAGGPELAPDEVVLPVRPVGWPAAAVRAALGTTDDQRASVLTGRDATGFLRYALRAIDRSRSAVFPIAAADRVEAVSADWAARLTSRPPHEAR
jgi:hypothetical protein